MMKTTKMVVFGLVLLALALPASVFAAAPGFFTYMVRNHSGQAVQFNYRGEDGVTHWVELPEGVSELRLAEGQTDYWADPACGHVAGSLNVDAPNKIVWVECPEKRVTLDNQFTCQIGFRKGPWFYTYKMYGDVWKDQVFRLYGVEAKTFQDLVRAYRTYSGVQVFPGCE